MCLDVPDFLKNCSGPIDEILRLIWNTSFDVPFCCFGGFGGPNASGLCITMGAWRAITPLWCVDCWDLTEVGDIGDAMREASLVQKSKDYALYILPM